MTKPNRSLSKVRTIYLATTIFLVGLSVYSFVKVKDLIDSSNWVSHSNNVTLSLEKIATAIIDAETNQKSFLLIGDSSCLLKRDIAFQMLGAELNLIDKLTKDNPAQNKNLTLLHNVINAKLLSMLKVLKAYSPLQVRPEFKINVAEGIERTRDVRKVINTMSLNETFLLDQRTKKYTRLAFITPMFIVFLFIGALLILLVSYLKINNALVKTQQLQGDVINKNIQLEKTRHIEESELRFRNMVQQAPVAICVLRGANYVVEIANEKQLELWGKTKDQVLDLPVFTAIPEGAGQGFEQLLAEVFATGRAVIASEHPATLTRNGKKDTYYSNFIYKPLYNINDEIDGIVSIATDVTEQVIAEKN